MIKHLLTINFIFSLFILNAQDYTIEAENGTLSGGGLSIQSSISGYSGTGYVGNFSQSGDKLTINTNVNKAGTYLLAISYNAGSPKEQKLLVNGEFVSKTHFDTNNGFTTVDLGKISLDQGTNTISIEEDWGYMNIDNFQLTYVVVPPHDYSKVQSTLLIDPDANTETVALYEYLKSNYGSKVISGQTHNFEALEQVAGKSPQQRAWDFQHYTKGYAYKWDNGANGGAGGHSFGWDDPGTTEEAINWYNSTNGLGIVSFQWHWHAPNGIGSTPSSNTFSTSETTFDLSQAIDPSHENHQYILEDIDSIATQLKKLETAGIPVLWRPLHEAGGEWFWWGAKGSAVCLELYDLVYDRLTNHHNIHNLIWVWSTPEEDWYPGNDKVDVFGYDSYPGEFIYSSQELKFDELYEITNGEKIIALTENGPIPDIDKLIEDDAMWAYFSSWDNLVIDQNSTQHIIDVYSHNDVITLESAPDYILTTSDFDSDENNFAIFPNPSNGVFHLSTDNNFEVINSIGKRVLGGKNTSSIDLSQQPSGIYLIKVNEKTIRVTKN